MARWPKSTFAIVGKSDKTTERCVECNCLLPAHYGSCSLVDPATKAMLDKFDAEAIERRAKRLDTSSLGPIKIDVSKEAQQAEIVRDACNAIAKETNYEGWWYAIAQCETDAVLAKLYRFLK